MNRNVLFFFLFLGIASSQEVSVPKAVDSVIHVHTAMDHISVLQFEDPVTKVAAGSPGFQIERDGSTVLIKPLRQNASTDLLVWTATNNRYAYELDPPGEVKNMNFAIDAPASKPRPAAPSSTTVSDVADMVLIRTLLGVQHIDNTQIKKLRSVDVKIRQVFRSAQSVYIQYSVHNTGTEAVKLTSVALAELVMTQRPMVSPTSFLNKQIEDQSLRGLGQLTERPIPVVRSERVKDVLQSGQETQGVIVIREAMKSPVIVQLTIGTDTGATKGTLVF